MLKLKKFLDKKGLTCRMCAAEIGISEKSMYNKISGVTDFTYSEFCKLRRRYSSAIEKAGQTGRSMVNYD